PEILEADLSSLLLTSLLWGEPDPRRLPLLDLPSAAAIDEANKRLASIGAIDSEGRVTDHGRAIAALLLEPRLAHMLIDATARGFGAAAADAAVLLTERGLGGNDPDLELRARRWRMDRSPRAEAARTMASNWRRRVDAGGSASGHELAKALALAFPERVSRRRDSSGETWQSIGGRGFRLDAASPLARSEWLAVGEVAGHASGARILAAAPIDERDVFDLFGDRVETRHDGAFDPATGSVTPTRSRRLGAIRLSSGPDPAPDQSAIEQALVDGARDHGLELLPWNEEARQLRQRAAFAHRFDRHRTARRRDVDRANRRMACTAGRRQTKARRNLPRSTALRAPATARLRGEAKTRPGGADRICQPGREPPFDRLFGRGRPRRRSARPGAVRPFHASKDRQGGSAAGHRHHVPGGEADPDHARSPRFLGRQLARRGQGHARPLSQAP